MVTWLDYRALARLMGYVVLIAFVAWCLFALRADLMKVSFQPLLRSWDVVLVAVSLSVLNYVVRSLRWQWYLRQLGFPLAWRFAALTYVAGFAFTLSPGKLGELIRARYYRGTGISLRHVAAAIFAERLMDLLGMLALATLAIAALPDYRIALGITATVAVLVAVLFPLLPRWSVSVGRRFTYKLPPLAVNLVDKVTATLKDARALLSLRAAACGFIVSVVAWGLEGIGFGALTQLASPSYVHMSSAIGIYAVAVLAGGLSLAPGGLGSTEAVLVALLVNRGYAIPDALLIALSCRFVTLWFGMLIGWLAVAVLHRRPDSEPAAAVSTTSRG